MNVNLIAVQAKLDIERYRSPEAFEEAMSGLVDRACAASDSRLPSVLVFPEGLGLFLSIAPYYYELIREASSVRSAVWRVGLRRWPGLLATALRFRTFGLRTALLEHGLEARQAYYETFSTLARREGVYIVAGTGLFPDVTQPPLKPARVLGRQVYNVAPLFTPSGSLLTQTRKVHRACRWEHRFAFAEGDAAALFPAETAIGRVGVLTCHDSLREELVSRMDALGTEVLAVPAYNIAPWHSKVRKLGITQEEAWLEHGLVPMMKGRENIQAAVCSMLVGSLFDLRSEGRSFICAGGRVLAIAETHDEEEVVATQVELDLTSAGAIRRRALLSGFRELD